MRRFALSVLTCLLAVSVIYAQSNQCSEDVFSTISTLQDTCQRIGRNEVCYVNFLVESELTEGTFDDVGQVIPVVNLIRLETAPYSAEDDEWGIAAFNLQANLPNTLPGQLITIIVFGDAGIEPDADASEDYPQPMQAFRLSTGIGTTECDDLPDGGVLIQNSAGEAVELLVNGYELTVNSTALLTASDDTQLTITTLEGQITVTDDDEIQSIPEGFTLSLAPDDDTPPDILPAPETNIVPSALLPDDVPTYGEPTTTAIGLLSCASSGGVDVSAGSTIGLRGGWAEPTIAEVASYASNNPPMMTYDGESIIHRYRTGPSATTIGDGSPAFAINWFWEVTDITAGTHHAVWFVDGTTVDCEIRAN